MIASHLVGHNQPMPEFARGCRWQSASVITRAGQGKGQAMESNQLELLAKAQSGDKEATSIRRL